MIGRREATLPNTFTLPSYAVVDAAVTLRSGPFRFQVDAYNLLDKDYIDFTSPTGSATALVGEPRTIRASVGYSF